MDECKPLVIGGRENFAECSPLALITKAAAATAEEVTAAAAVPARYSTREQSKVGAAAEAVTAGVAVAAGAAFGAAAEAAEAVAAGVTTGVAADRYTMSKQPGAAAGAAAPGPPMGALAGVGCP